MPAPFEMIIGPAEVYSAPVGEAFPDIEDAPAGNWALVGTLGSKNYTEAGVMVRFPRDFNSIYALGSIMRRKNVITQAGFEVEFDVMDATIEELAAGFGRDEDDMTTVAAGGGSAGHKSITLPTSPVPFQRALLVRVAQSPYMEGGNTQFEVFAADQVGNVDSGFSKDSPFTVKHLWSAVETSSGVAVIRAQHEAVSP